jgi:hypothetical protein
MSSIWIFDEDFYGDDNFESFFPAVIMLTLFPNSYFLCGLPLDMQPVNGL